MKVIQYLRRTVLLLVTLAESINAQSHGIHWSGIDGGGGSCGNSRFKLCGSIGQANAGHCVGGTFVQQGGFMPAFIKTVGPALTMRVSGNQITLTWPNVCTGFVVEGAATPNGLWSPLGSGTVAGANRQVVAPTSSGYHFFRLRKDCPASCASHCRS